MRALVALVIIAALLVGGDALVRSMAEGRVERQIARELDSDGDVEVALGGFPFTMAALSGRIPSATVSASEVRRGPLILDSVEMTLTGVELSLADREARVDRGSGSVTIDLGSFAAFIDRRTQLAEVSFADGEISATVPRLGRSFTAPIALRGRRVVVDVPVVGTVGVRLPRLFRGLDYSSLEVAATGASLRFEMDDAVLGG